MAHMGSGRSGFRGPRVVSLGSPNSWWGGSRHVCVVFGVGTPCLVVLKAMK